MNISRKKPIFNEFFFQIDMCAAPGSKTAQLIEAIHAVEDVVPKGKKKLLILFKNRFRM